MRRTTLAGLLAAGAACGPSEPVDPLDRELLAELAIAQGSARGDARSGSFALEFEAEACDCPRVELDGQELDLCGLAVLPDLPANLIEGSGVLGVVTPVVSLSGAIEADGSFVVAGLEDISTLTGPLEALRRIDGQFDDAGDRADGWAGQRLLGEFASVAIDCRWTGAFVAIRD